MQGKKKIRPFIDKKTASTFVLVPAPPTRDSERPVALQPVPIKKGRALPHLPYDFPIDMIVGAQPSEIPEDNPMDFIPPGFMPPGFGNEIKGLVHDYDYSQHLMPIGGTQSLLVEAVFGPDLSARVKPAKEMKEDGDLVGDEKLRQTFEAEIKRFKKKVNEPMSDFYRALEGNNTDGFDDGNNKTEEFEELQDDFVLQAMQSDLLENLDDLYESDEDKHKDQKNSLNEEDDEEDDGHDDGHNDSDERRRPTREMAQLEVDFERLMEEYDDDNIGELDPEDEEVQTGPLDEDQFEEGRYVRRVLDAYVKEKEELLQHHTTELSNADKEASRAHLLRLALERDRDNKRDLDEDIKSMYPEKPEEEWDCESIISTYSNVENHPHMIKEPERNKTKIIKLNRDGVPIGMSPDRRRNHFNSKSSDGKAGDEDDDVIEEEDEEDEERGEGESNNLGQARNKKETKEEKAARKRLAKEKRKESRVKNKIVKGVFKSEEQKVIKLKQKQKANFQSSQKL